MDWIRENKMLAGILGVIAAGVLGLGYVLYGAWTSYTETKEKYVALGADMARLESLPLSPTEANLAAKKALVEEYATNVNKLGTALLLLQDQVAPKTISDTQFQAKVKEKAIEVKKTAADLKVQIPAGFAYGFEPYIDNIPPNEAATELSGYLDAIESIVKLVMNCRVASIDLLERSQIPLEVGGNADTGASTKSKSKTAAKAAPKGATASTAASITEKRRINLMLTLDQGPLQTLMSRLANPGDMPHFASVRVLRVENQAKVGPSKQIAPPPPPSNPNAPAPTPAPEGAGGAVAPAVVEIKPPDPSSPDSVPVMGQEMLKVQMEIDLVKFLPAARGVATAAPGTPALR